jgi:hypothetical protein
MASAADTLTTVESELVLVEQWRLEELRRAGYDAESAAVIAVSHEVDLHQAVELLEHGCSVDLALQILL